MCCLFFILGLQWVYNSCGQLAEGTESYSSYSSQRNWKNGHYNTQKVCCHWNAIETEHLWSSNDSKVKVPWCQVIIINKVCPLPCTCFLFLIWVFFSFIKFVKFRIGWKNQQLLLWKNIPFAKEFFWENNSILLYLQWISEEEKHLTIWQLL